MQNSRSRFRIQSGETNRSWGLTLGACFGFDAGLAADWATQTFRWLIAPPMADSLAFLGSLLDSGFWIVGAGWVCWVSWVPGVWCVQQQTSLFLYSFFRSELLGPRRFSGTRVYRHFVCIFVRSLCLLCLVCVR